MYKYGKRTEGNRDSIRGLSFRRGEFLYFFIFRVDAFDANN